MTEPSEETPTSWEVRPVWPETLGESAQVVNQFVVSDDVSGPEGVYLLLGHLATPVFLTPEHAQQRFEQLGGAVMVAPRGSFYLTRKNAERLRDILDNHLKKKDK
jgi:hypothetical protein